ncbi:MAG: GAF domain-containing protein [Candidatus Eremiobacteraeota bacterium]|nr:GAF domain-containing protein [Candidatus Eremiobacteraeota bacterium]
MDGQLLETFQEKLAEPVSKEDYQQVLAGLVTQLRAERGCLWLERENKFLYEGDEGLRKEFPFSRQAVDAVLEQGRSFLSFDPECDPRIAEDSSLSLNVRCCMAASCTDEKGNVLVLAYFDNNLKRDQFTHRDLKVLKAVLSLVPGAVKVE